MKTLTLVSNDDGLVSLTSIYQQAKDRGLVDGRRCDPAHWSKNGGADFIAVVIGTLNSKKSAIYKTARGANGGTFAHWQIALAYAKYLSPELHMEVNEIYMRAKAGDVTLAEQIYDKATPKDQKFLEARIASKAVRRDLTDTLKDHRVVGVGYGRCTNALYRPILGGTAPEVKRAKGIPPKANLRDNLTHVELADLIFAERIARKRIEDADAQGNTACEIECAHAGHTVVAALVGAK